MRDSRGHRTDRVKRREAHQMRERAALGYDPTEIAKKFGRDPRTVRTHLGLSGGAELNDKQAGKEVLPSYPDPELGPHGRELFYFGQRLRDRPFVGPPDRLLAPAVDTGAVNLIRAADRWSMERPAAMWRGRERAGATGRKPADAEEERVEREWGPILYDARMHSLYDSFRQHLAGQPWLTLLDIVERERSAYLEEIQMWWADVKGLVAAYEDVKRAIYQFRDFLSPDALLRRLILGGQCHLCPLAGRGVPEDGPILIA